MIRRVALFVAILVVNHPALAAEPSGQTREPSWVKVTEHAAWKPRDSAGELVYRGKMWLFGGWFNSFGPFPNDVWCSSNGRDWTLVAEHAPWVHADLPTTLVFDDKMWIMGGWYDGRNPGASASNQVWSSTDGAEWNLATENAGWSPRLGAGGAVLGGKMWIIGGAEDYFFGDETSLRNDVWSSKDGAHWTCVLKEAPWAPRAYHAAVAFNGKLWVFAGGNYLPKYDAHNDVWSSRDGVNWKRELKKAPWAPRIWASAVVYKGHLWLLGGWSNNPSKNYNDVWYTADGKQWRELRTKTTWSPRHEQSAYVFQDGIYIAGGNPWPCTNDVWRLDVPDELLEAAPSREP